LAIDWTPDLLLAEGAYCPTSAVRDHLDRWRSRRRLAWCLLLPFPASKGHTSFGSLMLYGEDDAEVAGTVQAEIARATTHTTARDLASTLRGLVGEPARRWWRHPLGDGRATTLRTEAAIQPLGARLDLPLTLFRPPTWSTTIGVRFAVLAPDRTGPDGAGHAGGGLTLEADPDLVELQTMLNGTRQAVLHQHHRGSVRLSRRPLPGAVEPVAAVPAIEDYLPDPRTANFGPGLEFDDLLAEAETRHGGPLAVAVYLIDRRGDHLLQVAGRNVRSDDQRIPVASDTSPIALAVQDNRPPQIVNRTRSEPALDGSRANRWLGTGARPADFSQVVVPVPGTAAGGRSTIVGALVAQCRSGNGRVFGAHDLQYFEQLAGRISLRRANLLFSEATRSLAELTSHTMLASAGVADPARLDPAWRQLPVDFANAHPFLRRTLRLVHRQIPCIGVALGLLDVGNDRLVRVIEIGETGLVPETWPRRRPPPGLAGLGAFALRNGRLAEVANVGTKGAFRAFGGAVTGEGWGPVRSAMAAPVVVADRPIGVMVVAAAQEHVLGELTNFVQAATQQVCLSLILAQRAEERRAFAFSSSTALHAHEILKRADRLRASDDPTVSRLGDEIEQLVDVLRTPEGGRRLPGDPLRALDEAIAEVGVGLYVAWDNEPPELPPFPAPIILAVKRAAVEILKNSKLRMIGSQIQIRARIVNELPIPQLLIQLQHLIEHPLPDDLLPLLYRSPIEDPGGLSARRHYGAFTAGYWMRAVGGDVYLWRNETDARGRHWIGTAIEVPVFTLAPEPVR
jgi:hypothetical protein